jgi:anti-sigma B factor antagonist
MTPMASGADYTLIECADVTVVRMEIESLMSAHDVQRVETAITALVSSGGVRKMVLDLRRLRYASSAALGMLMNLRKQIVAGGGHLVLSNTQQLDSLLRMIRANTLFQIIPDTEDAIEALQKID